MTAEQFIDDIKRSVHDSALQSVSACLQQPPGRKPSSRLVELSDWYSSLSESDRTHVRQVTQQAIHSAIFGLLCVLDGVRGDGGFELRYVADGDDTLLNSADDFLHDIYQSKTYEEVFGQRA